MVGRKDRVSTEPSLPRGEKSRSLVGPLDTPDPTHEVFPHPSFSDSGQEGLCSPRRGKGG